MGIDLELICYVALQDLWQHLLMNAKSSYLIHFSVQKLTQQEP